MDSQRVVSQRILRRVQKAILAKQRKRPQLNGTEAETRMENEQALQSHKLQQAQMLSEFRRDFYERIHMGANTPNRDRDDNFYRKKLEPAPEGIIYTKSTTSKRVVKPASNRAIKIRSHEFSNGDRVCCIGGTGVTSIYTGKISRIDAIMENSYRCRVRGWYHEIPLASLRPVKTIRDPVTDTIEDVIVGLNHSHKLQAKTPAMDYRQPFSIDGAGRAELHREEAIARRQKAKKAKEEEEAAEEKKMSEETEHEIDTPRLFTEAKTWTPTLLRAPLPSGVIDELRGKYSKFRSRHDPEYLKKLADAETDRAEKAFFMTGQGQSMLSEIKYKPIPEKVVAAQLPEQLLQKIGQLMVQQGISKTVKGIAATTDEGPETGVAAAKWDSIRQQKRQQNRADKDVYWPVKAYKQRELGKLPVRSLMRDTENRN